MLEKCEYGREWVMRMVDVCCISIYNNTQHTAHHTVTLFLYTRHIRIETCFPTCIFVNVIVHRYTLIKCNCVGVCVWVYCVCVCVCMWDVGLCVHNVHILCVPSLSAFNGKHQRMKYRSMSFMLDMKHVHLHTKYIDIFCIYIA